MKIGPGWIPDVLEVSIETVSGTCRLTLIELEATEIVARASCRKYLPEDSARIVEALVVYLDTVIAQCRSTSDPRLPAFEDLRRVITGQPDVIVHTAGALRTSPDLVEDLPLIDQPVRKTVPAADSAISPAPSAFSFSGERGLTRSECDGLRRACRILHAVLMGRDHSGGTLKSWRNHRRKPLDDSVAKSRNLYPELNKLLSSKSTFGLRVDCDTMATELSVLWSNTSYGPIVPGSAVAMITRFVPVVVTFAAHESMKNIFVRTREIVRELVEDGPISKPWMQYAGMIETGDARASQKVDDVVYGEKD
jgi:hypothetical protein